MDEGQTSVNLDDSLGIGLRISLHGDNSDVIAKYGVAVCERQKFDRLAARESRFPLLNWDKVPHDRHAVIDFRALNDEDAATACTNLAAIFTVLERGTDALVRFEDATEARAREVMKARDGGEQPAA